MRQFILNNILLCVGVLVVLTSTFLSLSAFSDSKLKIVFLDVGQGDATFIITPNGRQVLVDTGAKGNIGEKLARYMPISDRSLDMVIMTHPDLDHVGGMINLVDRYDIDVVMHSGLLAGAPIYSAIAERIKQKEIPTMAAQMGQKIYLEKDIWLEIYSPHEGLESFESNDYSIVMKLVYGDTSVFLTGDATKMIEYDLVNSYGRLLNSDILKVGHHGSQTSTSYEFVEVISPQYGIISAGCNNRFGHPHGEVLATLFSNQVEVFDTCNYGDIVLESDGESWEKS